MTTEYTTAHPGLVDTPVTAAPLARKETTAMSLLEKAMDKGLTPEQLSHWMDLEKLHRQERAEQEYNIAFNACQAEMPIVVKDAVNKQKGNARYARLEAVAKVVTPIYVKHGFSLSFTEEDCQIEDSRRITGTLRHVGGHSERFHIDMPLDGKGAKGGDVMNAPQAMCSSLSYGQRRLICMIFALTVADSDQDGEALDAHLSSEQIATLNTLIEGMRLDNIPFQMDRFTKYLKVDDIGQIPQSQFAYAVKALAESRKQHAAKKQ